MPKFTRQFNAGTLEIAGTKLHFSSATLQSLYHLKPNHKPGDKVKCSLEAAFIGEEINEVVQRLSHLKPQNAVLSPAEGEGCRLSEVLFAEVTGAKGEKSWGIQCSYCPPGSTGVGSIV